MKNNKDNILTVVITLTSIYFFKELHKLFSIIFSSSHSNALSLLKTISFEDLKAGALACFILSILLFAIKFFISFLPEKTLKHFKPHFKTINLIIINILIMVFLLASFNIEQFNLITAILATSILIKDIQNKTKEQSDNFKAEQKVEDTSTKLKSDIQNITKKQNRKFLPRRHKKCP